MMSIEMKTESGQPIIDERELYLGVDTGITLHLVEWGDASGLPVLVLHGGGHDGSCWQAVCRILAADYRCIVPDARGHGKSDWSESGDYSCASQVADLVSLLDKLQIRCCTLVGHSMGGLNALELAGNYPQRVNGLVLVDVGTETRDSGLRRLRKKSAQPRASARRIDNGDRVVPGPSDARLRDHVPDYCGDAGYRRQLLRQANVPLLVLRGEHSGILSQESAETTAAILDGQVREIPGAGHNVSLANPVATARELRDFLDTLVGMDAF